MATVFLSYSREDSQRVRGLAASLEKDGHRIWWDEQIPGGDQFTQAIQNALEQADAVVVVWTKTSIQSAWVRDEAAYGRDAGKLVPVSLDGTPPPLGFREYQAIDLSGLGSRPGTRQVESLKKAIAAKAEKSGSDQGLPVAAAPQRPKRLWPIAAAAVAALTAAALIAAGMIDNPLAAAQEDTPSLAVLPFADLSPARDKAYFAEGVAEEILSTLATERGIKVLGRTSARLVERSADPQRLRKQLGITHLLEGSARSAGDQLRINVRLIDTADGSQLWEEEYQGRPADVFAVQDQIAVAVVKRLRGTLSMPKLRPVTPTDAETFQTYLAARGLMRNRTQKGLREAFTLAQKVISRDPDYAPGHALVAELYQMLSDDLRAYGTMPLAQARKLGTQHAKAAIRHSPETADGYAALGIHLGGAEALRPLRRAVELDPSRAEIRTWLGFALNDLGRHDEALAHYRAAADIDPLGFVPVNRYLHALAAAGQQRQAVEVVRQFISHGGDQLLEPTFMIQIAQWQAEPSAVIAQGRRMMAHERVRHQFFRLFIAAAMHVLGENEQATAVLLPMQDLHAAHYQGDGKQLRRHIARAGAKLWRRADGSFAFVHLANQRDWPALVQLYDQRGFAFAEFCEQHVNDAVPFAMALRAQGRAKEAASARDCLRKRLAVELGNKARLPEDWPGDLEFRRASLAALDGDRDGALRWLDRTVGQGWLGQPYSSRLGDYPQFDFVSADGRLAAFQRRIDSKIARERAELSAQIR